MADSFVLLRCGGIFLCNCTRTTQCISLIKQRKAGPRQLYLFRYSEGDGQKQKLRCVHACQVFLSVQTSCAQTFNIHHRYDVLWLRGR